MRNLFFLFASGVVFFTSCKKVKQLENDTIDKIQIRATNLMFIGETDDAMSLHQVQGDRVRLLIPFKQSARENFFRYKIRELTISGEIVKAAQIISNKRIDKSYDLFKISIKSDAKPLLLKGSVKENRRGYLDRVWARFKSSGSEQKAELGEVLSLYANCESQQQVCIDWYWVTYDSYTGEIVSENYMYTTCIDPCSFNSSGAGGTEQGNCNDVADEMKSGPTSNMLGTQSLGETSSERKFEYSWEFVRNKYGFWSYKSFEIGTHEKQPNNTWKWKSLVHTSVARSGLVVGVTLSCTIGSAIETISGPHAYMRLNYSIEATAICKGFPITNTQTNTAYSPTWHVDYQPLQ